MNQKSFQTTGLRGSKDRTGLISIVVPYYAETLAEAFAVGEPPMGLEEQNRTVEDVEGAGYIANITYEGMDKGNDEGAKDCDFDPSFSEEPIESHPLIKELIDRYAGEVDPKTQKVTFPSTMPAAGGGLSGEEGGKEKPNPLAGLSTYISLRSVFRMTYLSRKFPNKLLREVGTIKGSLPENFSTPKGRDWLVMPPKIARRGNCYQIAEEWMMSPPGGWPKSVYRLIEL